MNCAGKTEDNIKTISLKNTFNFGERPAGESVASYGEKLITVFGTTAKLQRNACDEV